MSALVAMKFVVLSLVSAVVVTEAQQLNVHCGPRTTVSLWGDPHMTVYGTSGVTTCAADGWRTYLNNPYIDLVAYASGYWVTAVHLTFLSDGNKVRYVTTANSLSKTLTVVDVNSPVTSSGKIQLIDVGTTVIIIDWNSLSMFLFRKHGNSYYFTVTMGNCLFDASCGLLVDGCPNDYSTERRRGKRSVSSQCSQACRNVDTLYRESCEFDCDRSGDTGVAEVTRDLPGMLNLARSQDRAVQGTTTTTTTTVRPPPTRGPPTRSTHRPGGLPPCGPGRSTDDRAPGARFARGVPGQQRDCICNDRRGCP